MKTPELVLVPALIGLPAAEAHEVAMAARLVAVDPDPDTPPTVEGTVTAQTPDAGSRVPAGEAVTIWVEPDSGGGGGNMPRIEPDKPLDGAGANSRSAPVSDGRGRRPTYRARGLGTPAR